MTDYSESAQQNPAKESDGKSLAHLFASDPLELSAEERGQIIEKFRQERKTFLQQEATPKRQKGEPKAKQDLNLDLDADIDI